MFEYLIAGVIGFIILTKGGVKAPAARVAPKSPASSGTAGGPPSAIQQAAQNAGVALATQAGQAAVNELSNIWDSIAGAGSSNNGQSLQGADQSDGGA